SHTTHYCLLTLRPAPRPTLFPYTTLFRSGELEKLEKAIAGAQARLANEKFVNSAPANVVQGARDLLNANIEKRAQLKSLLDSLRSEEHTSELQSRENLVCRLLLEKKKKQR